MSTTHQGGNIQPGLDLEEHVGDINAKRVSLASAATIFVVSNVGSAELSGNVTLNPGPNFIGIVTIANPSSADLTGNVTLNTSPNFIGITTVANKDRTITGNVTLSDSKTFIGLTTSTLGASPAFIGITTVANKDRTITGNLTLSDAKTFIGLTTTTLGASPAFVGIVTVANPSSFAGNVTLDDGSLTGIVGNVTLSDSKAFIGLVTAVPSTTARSITGNVTLSDAKTFIGLVTAVPSNMDGSSHTQVDIAAVSASLFVEQPTASSLKAQTVPIGNVSLNPSAAFIGLVTAVPAYRSASTIFTFIASNASHTTIFTPPSNERWFLKNLILSSAGDVRAEIRSGATQFVPYVSLATSGGYVLGPDQEGIPSRANNDAFVVGLQSAVTVSGMANVFFRAG